MHACMQKKQQLSSPLLSTPWKKENGAVESRAVENEDSVGKPKSMPKARKAPQLSSAHMRHDACHEASNED